MLNMTPQELARILSGDVSGHGVLAPGPGHSPKDRSMSVTITRNNPEGFVVYSFAGDDPIKCRDFVKEKAGWRNGGGFQTNSNGLAKPNGHAGARVETVYAYFDEQGEELFQVERLTPKGFRQRRPDGQGGWVWNMEGTRRVLYRLPETIEAVANNQPIFVCEGEKAVDAVVKLGVPATCSPGGALKWRDEYSQHLKGADIVILPDNDVPGEKHCALVAKSLAGVAANVRELRLPGFLLLETLTTGSNLVVPLSSSGRLLRLKHLKPRPRKGARSFRVVPPILSPSE